VESIQFTMALQKTAQNDSVVRFRPVLSVVAVPALETSLVADVGTTVDKGYLYLTLMAPDVVYLVFVHDGLSWPSVVM